MGATTKAPRKSRSAAKRGRLSRAASKALSKRTVVPFAAKSLRAKKTRTAKEFDTIRLSASLKYLKRNVGIFAWDLDTIRDARTQQMLGIFALPARLANSAMCDGAIFSSTETRLAPQRGLDVEVKPANESVRARRIALEAEALYGKNGIAVSAQTLASVNKDLAFHGVAFCTQTLTVRDDGSRVDVEIHSWPIETVRWDPYRRTWTAITQDEGIVDIVHGDGRWIVFQKEELDPQCSGALVPLALIWADRSYGIRDRSKASTSHGNAKMVGEMPTGVPLQNEDGSLSQEAAAFVDLLQSLHEELPAGVRPAGSKVDMLVNSSTSWQIFKDIVDSNRSDAARVLLGSDGTISDAGGNYVKSTMLFGVKDDIVESDLGTISRGLKTGSIDVWTAINFGTSDLAPSREYLIPDADEDARRESEGERETAFYAALDLAKKNGMVVDQAYVNDLAKKYKLSPAPVLLPATVAAAPTVALAPTDIVKVVTVNEARAAAGLPALPDAVAGAMIVSDFVAKSEAARAAAPVGAPTAAPPLRAVPSLP